MKTKTFIIAILICFILFSCDKTKQGNKRIKDSNNRKHFKNADFTFAVYGETANCKKTHARILNLISSYNVDLIVHSGNIIKKNPEEKHWDDLFKLLAPVSGLISRYYITPGENEIENMNEIKTRFPNIAVLMKEQTYYSFIYKKSLFLIIDAYMKEAVYRQHEYIISAIKNFVKTVNGPIFAFFHVPVYSTGNSGVSYFLTRRWLILLEHFRTNIIFSAKDKLYGRYKTSFSTSTICLVTGGGCKETHKCGKTSKEFEQYACISEPHFIYVGVKKNMIGVKVINLKNQVIDSFESLVMSRRHTRKGIPRLYRAF